MEKLKYPIGKMQMPAVVDEKQRQTWINEIETLPERLEAAVANLTDEQLDTPYRPGGWTVRQLVHHIADSHQNAFCRLKLTLTEDSPTIKPYDEAAWAEMPDYLDLPISSSLSILRGLHVRFAFVFKNMSEADFKKYYVHPEYGEKFEMEKMLCLYAWHGNHHLAHITNMNG